MVKFNLGTDTVGDCIALEGGGGGSSYDVMNTASTKSSMQANNSNYRKAFNPNENGPRPRENVGSYD